MIVEYIRYAVPEEQAAAFETAYAKAGELLRADSHHLSHEVSRGVEEPANFVVRIEWDSIEGHLEGFRKSPAFKDFYALVAPFYGQIQEMKHYSALG